MQRRDAAWIRRPHEQDDARHDGVLKIAVVRGGGLGDLLFAMPALDALAAAYPEAEIVLLGTALHERLLDQRPGPVTRVEVLPKAAGVASPDGTTDETETARFLERMRAERIDLACQLHGGGRFSNPFVLALGAKHTVGTATSDAEPLERTLPYIYYQHEVVRWLETVSLVGALPVTGEPRIVPARAERARGRTLLGSRGTGFVVIHPGATDPRRRWPTARFAEIARRASARGCTVVCIGDAGDTALADDVVRLAQADGHTRVTSLAGRLSLSDLVGVLARTDVFVGNDSGPRHLAQAVGTATVGIYWAGNLVNGGPLNRGSQRVQLAWTTHCPVCGRDVTQVGWTAERCEHDVSFVDDVGVDAVDADVEALLAGRALRPVAPIRSD